MKNKKSTPNTVRLPLEPRFRSPDQRRPVFGGGFLLVLFREWKVAILHSACQWQNSPNRRFLQNQASTAPCLLDGEPLPRAHPSRLFEGKARGVKLAAFAAFKTAIADSKVCRVAPE
jgi:hypothetical protein